MKSEEAHVGKRVRVRVEHRKASLRSQEGTITRRWGNPCHAALDVLLDDGSLRLFWYYELKPADDDGGGARSRNEVVTGP